MLPYKESYQESKGLYQGQYKINFKGFKGQSFFQRALVFSGQGAALPGMFKNELEAFPEFINLFNLADSFAAKHDLPPISSYILNPEKIVPAQLPIVRSLCLFVSQVSLFRGFQKNRMPINFLTAHSFGEYGALVAAEVISFEDMFEIIALREKSCPPANRLGYMIAVNAPLAVILEKIPADLYFISNINSPNQLTISTKPDNLEKLKIALKTARLGHKVLTDVAQPYHTPLMNPVKEIIQKHLELSSYSISPPKISFFSSVLKKLLTSENFNREEIKKSISDQIVESVDFPAQIRALYALGSINFVELSAQQICSLFIRDILIGEKIKITQLRIFLHDFIAGRSVAKKMQITESESKFLKAINGVVGAVTGYRISDLSIYDNFQEDLGVDSIKKAEIFFRVIEELGISEQDLRLDPNFVISEMKTIADIVGFVNRRESNPLKAADTQATYARESKIEFLRYTPSWIKAADKGPSFDYELKPQYLWLEMEDILLGNVEFLNRTIKFFNEITFEQKKILAIRVPKESKFESLGFLLQTQNEYRQIIKPFILFFRNILENLTDRSIVQRNIFIVSELSTNPTINAFESFLKSLVKEDGRISFKIIYSSQNLSSDAWEPLLLKETQLPFEFDILYSEGIRHIRSFKKIEPEIGPSSLTDKSVIVAIGGAKGITYTLLNRMNQKVQPYIYLVGRSSEDQNDVKFNLDSLRKTNAHVFYVQADAQDQGSLEKVIFEVCQNHGHIDYVINAAGIQLSQKLVKKDFEQIESELFAKLSPLIHLFHLSKKYSLGSVLNFSSIVALFGNEGQSVYCLANSLIEHYIRKLGTTFSKTHFKVIHWPAWDGVGMTANKGVHHILKRTGVSLINEEQAFRVFEQEFTYQKNNAVVYLDWDTLPKYDGGLINSNAYGPLLPGLCTYHPVMSLEKMNLTQHKYLEGHFFYQTYYLFPASSALTMFWNQSYLHFRENPVIKNFKAQNMLNLNSSKTMATLESIVGAHEIDFSIRTNIVHFQGEAVRSRAKDLQSLEFSHKGLQEINFADMYSPGGYTLRGDFMVMQRLVMNEEQEIYCECQVSKYGPRTGQQAIDRMLIFIETALQVPGFRHLVAEGHGPFPYQIENMQFFSEATVTEKIYYITKHKMFSAFESMVDVQLFNSKGVIIMSLENFHIKAEVSASTYKGKFPMRSIQNLENSLQL